MQATAVIKIFNTSTGAALQAVTVPVSLDERGVHRVPREAFGNRASDDGLIESVAIEVARRGAARVVEFLYPARVLAVTDGW